MDKPKSVTEVLLSHGFFGAMSLGATNDPNSLKKWAEWHEEAARLLRERIGELEKSPVTPSWIRTNALGGKALEDWAQKNFSEYLNPKSRRADLNDEFDKQIREFPKRDYFSDEFIEKEIRFPLENNSDEYLGRSHHDY